MGKYYPQNRQTQTLLVFRINPLKSETLELSRLLSSKFKIILLSLCILCDSSGWIGETILKKAFT